MQFRSHRVANGGGPLTQIRRNDPGRQSERRVQFVAIREVSHHVILNRRLLLRHSQQYPGGPVHCIQVEYMWRRAVFWHLGDIQLDDTRKRRVPSFECVVLFADEHQLLTGF